MTEIHVLWGTESGNTEMAADEIVDALAAQGIDAAATELIDVDVHDLAGTRALVLTSTYDDGGLPASTEPFIAALRDEQPDLGEFTFVAFGLGDKTYEFYNKAIDDLATALTGLGATKVGETGYHDSASGTSPVEPAVAWALASLDLLTPVAAN
ncbi:flavodoxin-like domain-containing protein [Curtobacterium albidum]|uniref:Flavodoxin-like domain-containing protein n=1 Tax=Curtobacterium citreum TaxID=2036 RepID=A0A850DUE8_9MICO|nr:flavodoxin family protein [Curtobacterium albidum]NUU27202.1 flavodoxin-like domain-containing protein [Curtobacterium albidum]